MLVSAFQFRHWPLTVDHGTVRCVPLAGKLGSVIFRAPDGRDFAVNGTAIDHTHYQEIDSIRKTRGGELGPLIHLGLKQC